MMAEVRESIRKIEELKEYERMADEINEMYQDANEKCKAAINAGYFEAAVAYIEFMEECSRQLANLTTAVEAY